MNGLTPLAMSQTKEDLLRHLDLPLEVYSRMAKETDQVYRWLTSEESHLKKNCKKGKPPYDWSDIKERSKDEAMERIAKTNDEQTRVYWNLAEPAFDCPNWIARWFLYHKFRYRDGRNRNIGINDRAADGSSHVRLSHREQERVYKREGTDGSGDAEAEGNGYNGDGESSYTNSSMHTYNDYRAANVTPFHNNHPTSASGNYDSGYTTDWQRKNIERSQTEYWDPVKDAKSSS